MNKNNILILCFVIVVSLYSTGAYAQVNVHEAPSINALLDSYMQVQQSEDRVKAWRIQIITTDDRRKMEAARNKFSNMFPAIKSTWVHESPYYKVKVGAYEHKMQLQGLLSQLKRSFRGVIPVVEKIKKKDLLY